MHTDTGRIYEPEQTKVLSDALEDLAAERAALREHELTEDDVADLREGRIVPVSEQVAQQVKLGQRELERRRRRRQAAKRARRLNR